MNELDYKKIIWAEMKPDVYDGEKCDQVRPRFECYTEGDMDSDFVDKLEFSSSQFPPGTKISVESPCCPECHQDVEMCKHDEGCDFDWNKWRDNEYS